MIMTYEVQHSTVLYILEDTFKTRNALNVKNENKGKNDKFDASREFDVSVFSNHFAL